MATLTFLVVANMIGAGVFTTSGFALEDLGAPGRVVLAWGMGGLIAMAGAICYGQLVRAMPESGGEYLFLSRAVHPLVGFIAGWVSLIAGFTGAIAFAATAFESYVFPNESRPAWLRQDTIAIAVVVIGGLCHGIHVRAGAVWQNIAVVVKLALLAIFLTLAIHQLGFDATSPITRGEIVSTQPLIPQSWPERSAFAISLVWISLSYSGFNAAVYLAEEADDLNRTVPRAMVLGTAITTVLYIALNAVFVFGAESDKVIGQPEVAVIAAEAIGGNRLASFVRAIICTALLTSVMSMMMAAPRVYVKMSEDGLMPGFFATGSSTGVPRAAVLAQVVLSAFIIWVSTLRDLLSYLGLTLSVSAAISVCCLFLPAVRRNRESRMTVWVAMLAVFYVACTLGAGLFLAVREPRQFLAMLTTFAFGGVAYGFVGLRRYLNSV